jgi:hypothetical protein
MKFRVSALLFISLAFVRFANAVPVTVNGTAYEITTVTTTFAADSAELMSQPWWGNIPLTSEFAVQVGLSFGYPNSSVYPPFFAYAASSSSFFSGAFYNGQGGIGAIGTSTTVGEWTFAKVATVPEATSTLLLTLLSFPTLLFAARRMGRE